MSKYNLTFRKIEMVEAVAKLGSVSAAARTIGISQPALTQGLKSIESELGVKLFNRKKGSLVPTPFAEPFLTYVDPIRHELLEAKYELVHKVRVQAKAKLRICAGIRSCSLWVNRTVSTMLRLRPDLKISLDHDLFTFYARLVNGDVDIGVTMVDLLPAASPRLTIDPLGEWEALFVCRREHPLAGLDNLAMEQLREYPLAGHFNYPVMLRMLKQSKQTPHSVDIASGWPTSNLPVDTLDALIGVVQTRNCLAIVPMQNVADELAEGSLVVLKLAGEPRLYVQLVLAYLADTPLSDEVRLFLDTVKSVEAMRQAHDEGGGGTPMMEPSTRP